MQLVSAIFHCQNFQINSANVLVTTGRNRIFPNTEARPNSSQSPALPWTSQLPVIPTGAGAGFHICFVYIDRIYDASEVASKIFI